MRKIYIYMNYQNVNAKYAKIYDKDTPKSEYDNKIIQYIIQRRKTARNIEIERNKENYKLKELQYAEYVLKIKCEQNE